MNARIYPVDAVSGAPLYSGRALRQTTVSPTVAQGNTARPLGGVSGVRPGTSAFTVSCTSTAWAVQPFLGMIDGESLAIAGTYCYAFDQAVTGAVNAAGASARTDRLDVQVSDPAESDGSVTPSVQIIYTPGTPGLATPPARSHPLAQINVPATGGGAPTVTWHPSYYAAPGGFVPFPLLADLDLWTTAALGQHASVLFDVAMVCGDYVYNGTKWVQSINDTGWINLTYAGTWTDFSSGYATVAVRRLNGITYLSAMAKGGNAAAGQLITTVPAGFRIGRESVIVTMGQAGAVSLEVYADGSVKAGPGGVNATWTSLSVSWIAEG